MRSRHARLADTLSTAIRNSKSETAIMKTKSVWDTIVIGGGSAGAVVASRLSEDADHHVLLLEAGHDYPTTADMSMALLSANMAVLDGSNWHINALIRAEGALQTLMTAGSSFVHAGGGDRLRMLRTLLHDSASATLFDYCVGKVIGGSSAVNGALALRGHPEDYDEWHQYTQGQWDWAQVLPYFRTLEDDQDFGGPCHGRGGPVPVCREQDEHLVQVQRAFIHACRTHGYPVTADHNDPTTTGIGIVPKNVRDHRRISSALAYLGSARARDNLVIVGHAHVHRLLWEAPGVCAGVEVEIAGSVQRCAATRVIICAGALNTPTLLMRSGVGAPDDLGALGIQPQIALAGVGHNLIDHAVVGLWAVPKPGASALGDPTHQAMLKFTAAGSRFRNDMEIHMSGGIDTSMMPSLRTALGAPVGMAVSACLMKPLSRGSLRLTDADPRVPPQVLVNCLACPEDQVRLEEGVTRAWELIQHPAVLQHVARIFAWSTGIMDSKVARKRAILNFVRPGWHVVGTARMGNADDHDAVVDAFGKVHGATNIWVADASIMPTIPAAPTNLTCMMIGERIAAALRQ